MFRKRLIDLCLFIRNGANIQQDKVNSAGYPITRIETLSNGIFNRDRMGYAGITDLDSYSEYVLRDHDLLFSHINGEKFIGRTVLYEHQCGEIIIHGMNLLCLRAKQDEILPQYLCYYLNSEIAKAYYSNHMKRAVNQASITSTDVKNIEIIYPSLEEQKTVVDTLNALHFLLQNYKKQLSLFDELIKSRFIEMFGDITQSTDGYVKLGSFATISSSKRVHASDYVANGVPFYRSKEIIELGEGKEPSIEIFISEEHYEQIKKKNYIPTKGDILMSAVGTIGKMWIVDGKRTFYYKDGNILCIHSELSNPIYLSFALSLLIDTFKDSNVVGSAYSALTIVKLNEMLVPLADTSKQNKFAEFVKLIDKSKFSLQQQIKHIQELINFKMAEYFSGEED